MRHKRLVNALIKTGAVIKDNGNWVGKNFLATKGETTVSWHINGSLTDGDGEVTSVWKRSPQTNAMVDLFMDQYESTIKGAVLAINSPPLT